MISVRDVTAQAMDAALAEKGVFEPLEQTALWATYESTVPGRTFWGACEVSRDGEPLAYVMFMDYQTHGYHYLRAHHGPVYLEAPDEDTEAAVVDAIAAYVRKRDRRVAFMRMAVEHELPSTRPVLSTAPYNETVVIDLDHGDPEEILANFKARGRRDVRKALRECDAVVADETAQALEDFEPYYAVMVETGERDGFRPAPAKDYVDMLRILGPEHARLIAARMDGELCSWSINTVQGERATRYYGASLTKTKRTGIVDRAMIDECTTLAGLGCTGYDLMGIGNDFSPTLKGLNTFKTKFSNTVTSVAPDRDVPVKKGFYAALVKVRDLRDDRRAKKAARLEALTPDEPREDILPVVLGGDIGAYALGREFHEAFGVKSVCVASAPIGAISHSKVFTHQPVEHLTAENVRAAVASIAEKNADKTIVLVGNTDALVDMIIEALPKLPENVVSPVATAELVDMMSDKARFAELCAEHGIETPVTEVVDLSGDEEIAPTKIAFPLVAKPAVSSEYADYLARGFKKVYFVNAQSELDALWKDLRAAGFAGTFLVQELIGGDDTYMDSVTVYMDADGNARLLGAAQVLLEDHAPSMLGNPVAMVTRPMPEQWKKASAMLAAIGWRGFANFDIKRDPATGRVLFLEMNPRIGRNSYYNAAAGVNPMRVMVNDLVDHAKARTFKADGHVLYTLVPLSLVRRYVRDEDLAAEVDALIAAGAVADPQRYVADRGLRRMLDVELTERNQVRKFAQYYPEPTETSF